MKGPLDGIKVLDLGRFIAGPYCAQLLGDMGAEVIKIEGPKGDDGRKMIPAVGDMSTYFMASNKNKGDITLDLKSKEGKEILWKLLEDVDVVVENFRPGIMEAMGFGWEELHKRFPGLILASVTGFGQDGPYAHRPAYDSVAQAMGGLMNATGEPEHPVQAGTWVGDYTGGLYAAFGVAMALYRRELSGIGQHIDVALLDCIFSFDRTQPQDFILFNKKVVRRGHRGDYYRCPVGSFDTKDGLIYITATTQKMFLGVCEAAGHPEWGTDPRFLTEPDRLAHSNELNALITEWTTSHTKAEVIESLVEKQVPCSPINDIEEVLNNPQIQHRDQIVWRKTVDGVDLPLYGVTVKMSETPGEVQCAPPRLGQDNERIYKGKLGMSDDEFNRLKENHII